MAETLVANGDEDDYFKRGIEAAEAYASGFRVVEVDKGEIRQDAATMHRRKIAPFAGYITTRRHMPRRIP